MSLRQPRHLR